MAYIGFRCTEEQKKELHYRSKGNLSEYITEKLFSYENRDEVLLMHIETLAERLDEISDRVESSGKEGINNDEDSLILPAIAEMLLMLRSQMKRDAIRSAQSEVKRIGLDVFDTESLGRDF